jgi:hypothetical protein
MAVRVKTILSWIALLAVLVAIGFFGYHILDVSTQGMTLSNSGVKNAESVAPSTRSLSNPALQPSIEEVIRRAPAEDGTYEDGEHPGPVGQRGPPIPNEMPEVPGQTEEDLRSPEPLQATPPSVQYSSPEATDPMNRTAFMSSEFGNNFRHPEQMIEMRPPSSMATATQSQIASEASGPGGNNAVGFAPEMAQNGGDFMRGIGAFDSTEIGTGFSMI